MGAKKGQTFNRYTKEDVIFLIRNWDTMTLEQLSEKMNRSIESVNYLRTHLSLNGYKLAKKDRQDSLKNIISSALSELNIPYKN